MCALVGSGLGCSMIVSRFRPAKEVALTDAQILFRTELSKQSPDVLPTRRQVAVRK